MSQTKLPDGHHEVEGRVASKGDNSIGILEVFASGAAGVGGATLCVIVPESRMYVMGAIALYTPIRIFFTAVNGNYTYRHHEDPK